MTPKEKYIKAAEQLNEMASSIDRIPQTEDIQILLKISDLLIEASIGSQQRRER